VVEDVPVVGVDEVAAERIQASLATYRWLFGEDGWVAARTLAPAIGDALAEVAPHWLDELAVWATAAGADLDDLLVLNARSEVLSLVRAERRRGECTVLAEPGLLGQTWDWYGRQREAVVVLRTAGLLTLTEAGMLGKVGVNEHGLGVGLTFLASVSDGVPGRGTLPVHAVLRLLLERSSSVATALAALEEVRLTGSACIALADPSTAALVEITPDGRAVLPAGVHTNHCLDPALRRLQGPVRFLDDSEGRRARAEELRQADVPLRLLLADTAGGYAAIDQPPDPALEAHDRTATILALVVEPARRALHIAPGRPSETGFSQVVRI
jgi:isopenicillin-N N-acyltransferase-like protein